MGEMQEKLHIRLTADICLWYDDIVEALCEGGPLFLLLPIQSRGHQINGARGKSPLKVDEYRAAVAYA